MSTGAPCRGSEISNAGQQDAKDLAKVKPKTKSSLDALSALIEADAKRRAEG